MSFDDSQQKILKIAGLGCGVLAALFIAGVYLLFTRIIAPMFGGPKALGPVGVVQGQGLVQRSIFFADEDLGEVTDVAFGELDPDPRVALVVAGRRRADFLGRDFRKIKSLRWPGDGYSQVMVVDVEGDGACDFWNRGSWSDNPALLGHDGKVRWEYQDPNQRDEKGVEDSAPGDLNGDGKLEFAVSRIAGAGVTVLDTHGAQLWNKPGHGGDHVEIADANGDGKREILCANTGALEVLDRNGHTLSNRPSGLLEYLIHFAVFPWPDSSGRPHVIFPGKWRGLVVADGAGKLEETLPAPQSQDLYEIYAAWVKLKANEPAYLAVLGSPAGVRQTGLVSLRCSPPTRLPGRYRAKTPRPSPPVPSPTPPPKPSSSAVKAACSNT